MIKILKIILNHILSKTNYRIVNLSVPYGHNAELEPMVSAEIWNLVQRNSMLSDVRLAQIVKAIDYLHKNNIAGDIIECGIWKGGSVALMAHRMLQVDNIRDLHLFDVFDEICEPDYRYDGERAITEAGGLEFAQGRMNSVKGIYNNPRIGGSGNMKEVRQLIVDQIQFPQESLHIHQGWFQDTIPKVAPHISSIAMLRLDADLYASTKIAMEYYYPKLANKGIIIVDDYGAYEGCRKAIDDYLKDNKLHPFMCHLDHECIYWIK